MGRPPRARIGPARQGEEAWIHRAHPARLLVVQGGGVDRGGYSSDGALRGIAQEARSDEVRSAHSLRDEPDNSRRDRDGIHGGGATKEGLGSGASAGRRLDRKSTR